MHEQRSGMRTADSEHYQPLPRGCSNCATTSPPAAEGIPRGWQPCRLSGVRTSDPSGLRCVPSITLDCTQIEVIKRMRYVPNIRRVGETRMGMRGCAQGPTRRAGRELPPSPPGRDARQQKPASDRSAKESDPGKPSTWERRSRRLGENVACAEATGASLRYLRLSKLENELLALGTQPHCRLAGGQGKHSHGREITARLGGLSGEQPDTPRKLRNPSQVGCACQTSRYRSVSCKISSSVTLPPALTGALICRHGTLR